MWKEPDWHDSTSVSPCSSLCCVDVFDYEAWRLANVSPLFSSRSTRSGSLFFFVFPVLCCPTALRRVTSPRESIVFVFLVSSFLIRMELIRIIGGSTVDAIFLRLPWTRNADTRTYDVRIMRLSMRAWVCACIYVTGMLTDWYMLWIYFEECHLCISANSPLTLSMISCEADKKYEQIRFIMAVVFLINVVPSNINIVYWFFIDYINYLHARLFTVSVYN